MAQTFRAAMKVKIVFVLAFTWEVHSHHASLYPTFRLIGRITDFARRIKAQNNATRVLYYQNTLINFGQTLMGRSSNKTLNDSLLLHDLHGRLVYLGGCGSKHAAPNHTIFDHSLPAMREVWRDNIVQVQKLIASCSLW